MFKVMTVMPSVASKLDPSMWIVRNIAVFSKESDATIESTWNIFQVVIECPLAS